MATESSRCRHPHVSSPRGFLATPPEVKKLVTRELKGHPVTDDERKRIRDCFNLQYYFGGEAVAYRQTDQGVDVLAVGLEEIKQLFQRLSAAQRQGIVIGQPDPW